MSENDNYDGNARLIVAAPELLAALKAAMPVVKAACHKERKIAEVWKLVALRERMEAAIAASGG
jgi:hypothetical protein